MLRGSSLQQTLEIDRLWDTLTDKEKAALGNSALLLSRVLLILCRQNNCCTRSDPTQAASNTVEMLFYSVEIHCNVLQCLCLSIFMRGILSGLPACP